MSEYKKSISRYSYFLHFSVFIIAMNSFPAWSAEAGKIDVPPVVVMNPAPSAPSEQNLKDSKALSQSDPISAPAVPAETAEKPAENVPLFDTGGYDFENERAENPVVDIPDSEEGGTITGPSSIGQDIIGEDEFFDSEEIVATPKGRVGREGPAPVNPKDQPASKLVIVDAVTPKDNKSAQLVSAERAQALGLNDAALKLYDDLYAQNPKDSQILMGRAVTLQKLGRFDEAMQTYEELSTLEPKNIEVKINMLGLLAKRYPAVALRRLMDLHDEDPQNVGLIAQIAVTAANLGDYETSMRFLGIAISMQPNNASHIFNAAVILDRAGKKKDAITYYEKALEVDSVYGSGRSIPRDTIYERLANLR
jgi:Flp pilus assembly protein TadD